MHGRPARDVLHLEGVAGRIRARRDDLLRIAYEEGQIGPIGAPYLAVFLGDLVIHVRLGGLGVEHDLEPDPGELAFVDRAHGTFERRDVHASEAFRDARRDIGRDMRIVRDARVQAGKILGEQIGRDAMPHVIDDLKQSGPTQRAPSYPPPRSRGRWR